MKKKQRRRIMMIATVSVIIGAIVGYNYYIDQVKIKGGIFGSEIQRIQDDLTGLQVGYQALENTYKEDGITREEFLKEAGEHLDELQELIGRYDGLQPPEPFKPSVKLFKLSAQSQLERDRQIALWIETGDESHNIRAEELTQESFSYELAALADFKSVQLGSSP